MQDSDVMMNNIYKKAFTKIAYGGDLVGDGTTEYARADFYSIDPEFDDDDVLRDRKRYAETIASMKEYANDIRRASEIYKIDDEPVTQVVLSRAKYNETDNMDGLEWSNKVDAAIANHDINAIKDLATYGYAWYGTDKGKNLNPMRKLRMDSSGRIILSEAEDNIWPGLGVLGGLGLLVAAIGFGRKYGWFGMKKQGDFSSQIYDEDIEGDTNAAKYKSINKIMSAVLSGDTSGWQHGENKGKVQSLYVRANDSIMPYTTWKEQVGNALSAANDKEADRLLRVTDYYGVTDDPKNTYNDIIRLNSIDDSRPMPEKDLRLFYGTHPKLANILAAAKMHRELTAQEEAATEALNKKVQQLNAKPDAIRQEMKRALGPLDAIADKAFGAYYDASTGAADKDRLAELYTAYSNAQAAYDKMAMPFTTRIDKHEQQAERTLKPYNDAVVNAIQRIIDHYSAAL